MIALNEIKKAITRKLGMAIPDIRVVTEDISQVTDAERRKLFPVFHVQLQPLTSVPASGGKTLDRVILIDITYMEETVSTNAGMYEVFDRLQAALGFYLEVAGRCLKMESFSSSIVDDLAHLTFQLEFNDELPWSEESYELFGELKMDDFIGGN